MVYMKRLDSKQSCQLLRILRGEYLSGRNPSRSLSKRRRGESSRRFARLEVVWLDQTAQLLLTCAVNHASLSIV